MKTVTLYCPSVTYAQKGQRLLSREGIVSRLSRNGLYGCSFGIVIAEDDRNTAVSLLKNNGVIFNFSPE